MADFTVNTLGGQETNLVKLDLSAGPHALNYNNSYVLYVDNKDGGNVTVNLLGNGVASHNCSGYGDIDVSAGFDFVVAAGETKALRLTSVSAFMGAAGNAVAVTITGATNSEGWLIKK